MVALDPLGMTQGGRGNQRGWCVGAPGNLCSELVRIQGSSEGAPLQTRMILVWRLLAAQQLGNEPFGESPIEDSIGWMVRSERIGPRSPQSVFFGGGLIIYKGGQNGNPKMGGATPRKRERSSMWLPLASKHPFGFKRFPWPRPKWIQFDVDPGSK